MRVLVTDGDNRAALATTRALGRLGHDVLVGERRNGSLAHTSRYCRARVVYPNPVNDSDRFVESLSETVRAQGIDVLMPVADITTFLVTEHRQRFACEVPCAPADVVQRAANKIDIVATAAELGVPVPVSVVVEDPSRVPAFEHLGFPVVIKPWKSRIRTDRGWASTAVSFADTREALLSDLASRPSHEFPVLLQERLIGPGLGVFVCMHQGRLVATFSHRRLRERPPWGGVSVLSESTAIDPEACRHAARLLKRIGWQGAAMVEFKRDERDGLPKLMEINGRFWGSMQLAVDAGVNFPALALQTVTGQPFEATTAYRIGVRERWFWGDVDALLVSLWPGSNSWRLAGRSKLRALRDFCAFVGQRLHYDNPKADDWWPFVTETRTWFRTLAEGASRAAAPAVTDEAAVVSVMAAGHASPGTFNQRSTPFGVTHNGDVRIRIARSFEELGLDEGKWNALVASSSTNSVFQTYQWVRSWADVYGRDRTCLFVVAEGAEGTLGVIPLVVDATPGRPRVARFVGDGRADYSDVLAPSGSASLIERMVEALLLDDGWDGLDLHNIPKASPTSTAIEATCSRHGVPAIVDADAICSALLIEGREDGALRVLTKPSLRRRRSYFARTGGLSVRHLTTVEDVLPLLDAFFDQHVRRWAGSSTPSLFTNEQNRQFYRTLTRRLADTPWLLFTSIEQSGRPIAMHYGFDYDGVVTWYKPSFEPAVARHSPGLALLGELIDYSISNRRRELDFTWGDEPFKARFTNHIRHIVRLQVFRKPMRYAMARVSRTARAAARLAIGTS